MKWYSIYLLRPHLKCSKFQWGAQIQLEKNQHHSSPPPWINGKCGSGGNVVQQKKEKQIDTAASWRGKLYQPTCTPQSQKAAKSISHTANQFKPLGSRRSRRIFCWLPCATDVLLFKTYSFYHRDKWIFSYFELGYNIYKCRHLKQPLGKPASCRFMGTKVLLWTNLSFKLEVLLKKRVERGFFS